MVHADDATVAPLLPSSTAPPPRRNMFPFLCATLASMTTILMGYNLALMSGAELFIREDLGLSDTQTEVLVGCSNVYMLVSIVAAGWAGDVLGRRATLVLANALLMAGALAMALGGSYAALMAARFVTSLGSGFVRVVVPVYNAEISPPSSRGVLSTLLDLVQLFINLGTLFGYVSNYAFAGMPVHLGWRVMYAVGVFPPVLLAAAVLAVPESPQWLAMRGRHDEAHAVLLRTSDTPAEAGLRLEEIKHAAAKAPQTGGDGESGGVSNELSIVRPSASLRRVLVCVVGLQFFVHAVGTEAVMMYSPLVFRNAGMATNGAALVATVAVGAVKTCFVLVATLLSDRAGRRPLLLASAAGVAVALVSISLTLRAPAASSSSSPATGQLACVASVLAFVAAFSIGLGPLVATYTVEILPLRLRARGSSLGMVVNRATCALVGMTFISLANWITMAGCFFLYACAAVAMCVFVYLRVKETKGRSLEDMEVLFAK
ncbi:hypothetical protein EJB05_09540 [Eragrostis curvula]|uniref:Major facilitator superfamily (MFS) profile domain-containing protein n=1 Tax=Eragrostis curvula TaxID=38414 RepID=A0A5J9W2Y7_9POAL|nr:hypothetical protein EJB05_09540 [Eragrostis curvula]